MTRQENWNMAKFQGTADMVTAPKLTKEQIGEIKDEITPCGRPVRFMFQGRSLNIVTGELCKKGINIMYQIVYWNFEEETSKKIASWLGVKAVFSD